jgi:DNA repair protein RadA/Sms
MAKSKTVYVCQNCGAESPKWIGRCNSCGEWNTYTEHIIHKSPAGKTRQGDEKRAAPEKIADVSSDLLERIMTRSGEFDRVLGGGLVPGSLVLIGGEPGIGKSTLALQIVLGYPDTTLYVSGEESLSQIKMRSERMKATNESALVLSETSLEAILNHIKNLRPSMVVIDSIQTMYSEVIESSPGSVSQVRECAAQLLRLAKESAIPILLIGHITKEGSLAGPKILEHIVDTVLQFEGDTHHLYRILRASKNRFGSTSELGVYEMRSNGLKEILNPSDILLNQQSADLSGSAVAANVEGNRPLLVEVQALVSTAAYGTPQRTSTGFDTRRLNMLLAVLEKRANFHLSSKDVFINIAGGLRVDDPAIDLAVISAVLSSTVDIAIGKTDCFAGEVGLSGEIRPVNRIEQRINEAQKLGFKRIFVSRFSDLSAVKRTTIEIVPLAKVQEIPKHLFS